MSLILFCFTSPIPAGLAANAGPHHERATKQAAVQRPRPDPKGETGHEHWRRSKRLHVAGEDRKEHLDREGQEQKSGV